MGAGPAGTALALVLARRGVAVTLVEASRRNDRHFRGEALLPSGLAALETIGGPALLADLPHRPLAGWRFVLDGQELFRAAEPLEDGPACTLVSQPALLDRLQAEALQHPGCRLLRGCGAADLLEEGGRVVGVRLGDGRPLRADLVVACDGRRSLLRRRAGLVLEERGRELQVHWFAWPAAPEPLPGGEWFTTLVGPAGLVSLFTSAAGMPQLAWVQPPGLEAGVPWSELWARQAPSEQAHWLRHTAGEPRPPVVTAVRPALAARWHRPGLLLLGDAAHPMSPVRAQGLNMALRDAVAAARELLPLLDPPEPPPPERIDGALARIEARRRPEVAKLQELQEEEARQGTWLQRSPWLRQALRAAAPLLAPAVRHRWIQRQHLLRQGLPPAAPLD
ncbi:MAG: FAD-dependent monooxygenase [Synechococcus sp.]|nr:FAD-dependent monooxygenase [Synechococcus sp.]